MNVIGTFWQAMMRELIHIVWLTMRMFLIDFDNNVKPNQMILVVSMTPRKSKKNSGV